MPKHKEVEVAEPADVEVAKPALDDKFWFDYSAQAVKDAIKKRNEGAAKLQSLVVWLWGIYTASATVGVALSKSSYPLPIIILIALPSPLLIAAYWIAVWAQIPVTTHFHASVPETIKESYAKDLKTKNIRIHTVLALSILAALFVSVALVAASLSKQTSPPTFKASPVKDGGNALSVSGSHLPAETSVTVRILPGKVSAVSAKPEEFSYVTSASGQFQTPQPLKPTVADEKYDVIVEWADKEGMVHGLKRTVTVQSKARQKKESED